MKGLKSLPILACLFAGCATTAQKPSAVQEPAAVSKEAAARSQAYMVGADYLQTGSSGLSGASCRVADKTESWKSRVSRAETCVHQKNWKTLRTLGESLAASDVDSPWGAYFLSLAAGESGDLPRALWMVELAQKKVGGKAALFSYQRARVLLKMKDVSGAIAEMQKALTLDPRFIDGQLFLAEVYARDLDLERAKKYYQSALAIDPKNVRAIQGLAETRRKK